MKKDNTPLIILLILYILTLIILNVGFFKEMPISALNPTHTYSIGTTGFNPEFLITISVFILNVYLLFLIGKSIYFLKTHNK